ncbi:MAG: hypothetical protein II007_02440 [Gammaproteobacteria bacterium]|nr:hypothetical protein [Gammaproteobacteria bacterium]
MTIVMQMSTDPDIVDTALDAAWQPVTNRYSWAQIKTMNLGIAAAKTIVVIAHGNNTEIGNAKAGKVDIVAETFLALIQGNMQGAAPAKIFISTCGQGIAQFAARVRLAAEQNDIWSGTKIFGHSDPVYGPVPPPHDVRWFEIF